MSRILALSVALLIGATTAASAERLTAGQMIDVLIGQERVFSGGSVSAFRADGTYEFRHTGGDERGTYIVTSRNQFVLTPEGGREYALELDDTPIDAERPFTLIYATGANRGATYGMR